LPFNVCYYRRLVCCASPKLARSSDSSREDVRATNTLLTRTYSRLHLIIVHNLAELLTIESQSCVNGDYISTKTTTATSFVCLLSRNSRRSPPKWPSSYSSCCSPPSHIFFPPPRSFSGQHPRAAPRHVPYLTALRTYYFRTVGTGLDCYDHLELRFASESALKNGAVCIVQPYCI